MKYSIPLLLCLLYFTACKQQPTTESTVHPPVHEYDMATIEGSYTGSFGSDGDITLHLRHLTAQTAVGYNVHKGLRRNMSGSVQPAPNGYELILNEPGDNAYDGVFDLLYDTATHQITGTWKPLVNKELTGKTLTLKHITDSLEAEYDIPYSDSLGDLLLKKDREALYTYYPKDSAGVESEQLIEIRGHWKKEQHTYIIDWENNTVFPNRQSHFKEVKQDDSTYLNYQISGEGRFLEMEGD